MHMSMKRAVIPTEIVPCTGDWFVHSEEAPMASILKVCTVNLCILGVNLSVGEDSAAGRDQRVYIPVVKSLSRSCWSRGRGAPRMWQHDHGTPSDSALFPPQ